MSNIRQAVYDRILEAERNNELLQFRVIAQDLNRSMSTIHHHVDFLRQAGYIHQDYLSPTTDAVELPRELLAGFARPDLRRKANSNRKPHKRPPTALVRRFDKVLDMFGDLPSGPPQFEAAWDALLDLRERFNAAGC